jgi:hypothetical protein
MFGMHVREKMHVDMKFLHVNVYMQFFSEHACWEKNAC